MGPVYTEPLLDFISVKTAASNPKEYECKADQNCTQAAKYEFSPRFTVKVGCCMLLPNWVQLENTNDTAKTAWKDWMKEVEAHEDEHVKFYNQAVEKVEELLGNRIVVEMCFQEDNATTHQKTIVAVAEYLLLEFEAIFKEMVENNKTFDDNAEEPEIDESIPIHPDYVLAPPP